MINKKKIVNDYFLNLFKIQCIEKEEKKTRKHNNYSYRRLNHQNQ